MSSQISNIMSLEDHIAKINLAKIKVKISIFEMAEAITDAVNQLENRQIELASKLGISKGTLSKWLSIGSSNSLITVKELAPNSFKVSARRIRLPLPVESLFRARSKLTLLDSMR